MQLSDDPVRHVAQLINGIDWAVFPRKLTKLLISSRESKILARCDYTIQVHWVVFEVEVLDMFSIIPLTPLLRPAA